MVLSLLSIYMKNGMVCILSSTGFPRYSRYIVWAVILDCSANTEFADKKYVFDKKTDIFEQLMRISEFADKKTANNEFFAVQISSVFKN